MTFTVRSKAACSSPTSTEMPRVRPPPGVRLLTNSPTVGEVSPGRRVPPWDGSIPSPPPPATAAMVETTVFCIVVVPRSLFRPPLSARDLLAVPTTSPPWIRPATSLSGYLIARPLQLGSRLRGVPGHAAKCSPVPLPPLPGLPSLSLARSGAFALLCALGGFADGWILVRLSRFVLGTTRVRGAMVDDVVLDEGDEVGGDPVDEEACWEAHQEEAEDYGQDAHEPLLLGGRVPERPVLGGHHGEHVGDGQDEERVGDGQVFEPEQAPAGEALEVLEALYRVVERDKDREMHDDGEAPPQRIDLPLLVELHDLFLLLAGVVLVPGAYLVHVRLELLHPAHALDLPEGQREEEGSHDDREHHDAQPPGSPPTVEGRERGPHEVEERVEEVSERFDHARSFHFLRAVRRREVRGDGSRPGAPRGDLRAG